MWLSFPYAAVILALLALGSAKESSTCAPITRNGAELQLNGERWAASGANVYWLGLDENVIPPPGKPFYPPLNASYPTKGRITEAIKTVKTMGGRVVRSQTLGVSVGNPLSLWPTLNERNPKAFDTIDWTVAEARKYGIRLQVPLIDNYDYYHGGKFTFLRWRGINIDTSKGYSHIDPKVLEFYTNEVIINDFKEYIHYLLTHKNKYTGLSMAEDPIVAIVETGNELCGPDFGDKYVPNSWTREILGYVKSLSPQKLLMDGTYGVNTTHLSLDVVDMFTDHFYPLNRTLLKNDIKAVGSVDRVYQVGEYDWTGANGGASLRSFYSVIEDQQSKEKPVVSGDLFWSLFMHNVPNCQQYVNHTDGFSLQYGNPQNTQRQSARIKKIRQHFFKLQGKDVGLEEPPVSCSN